MRDSSMVAKSDDGRQYSIGTTSFQLRVSTDEMGGAFGVLEFWGAEGPWTIPHVHERGRESFYVIDGKFTFRIGDEERQARPGDFVSVAPNTTHAIRAEEGGGRLLALVPGQLEEMFIEMAALGPDALTDPAIRRELAQRHDSQPV